LQYFSRSYNDTRAGLCQPDESYELFNKILCKIDKYFAAAAQLAIESGSAGFNSIINTGLQPGDAR
jgi:hypothetical protein